MSAAPTRDFAFSTQPAPSRSRNLNKAASANASRAATPSTTAICSNTLRAKQRPAGEWLADYAQEIDNLRAALDWAFAPDGDVSIGVALTNAAVPLWMSLSLLEECRSRAKQALDALGTRGCQDPREEMRLHAALGASTSQAPEMGAAFTKALEIAESLGDTEYQLRALGLGDYPGDYQPDRYRCW
jgi:hypothetical protein